MEDERIKEVLEKMNDADVVLVGLGTAFELSDERILQDSQMYIKYRSDVESFSKEEQYWIGKAFVYQALKNPTGIVKKKLSYYNQLLDQVKDKDYFVVSTCRDGLLEYTEFDQSKTVKPCGDFLGMQCNIDCLHEVVDTKEHLTRLYDAAIDGTLKQIQIIPSCPHCQNQMIFNIGDGHTEYYSESRYLPDWETYREWLQRTLNKKILLLELGVSFDAPTVIRWPFEKIAYINKKAYLVRVNDTYYQLTEELKGKGTSINADVDQFFKTLTEPEI